MKSVEQRKKTEKVRGAASLIRFMSEELTGSEINKVLELENSILKRVSKK